jgi:hypothetical protein
MKMPLALPSLDGRRGTIVLVIYRLLALATAIVVIGSAGFNGVDTLRNIPGDLTFGFRTYTDAFAKPQVGDVTPAATRAGLRTGDRILAVDANWLPDRATEFDIGAKMAAVQGNSVLLAISTAGAPPRPIALTRIPGSVWTNIEPSSGLPLWLYVTLMLLTFEVPAIFLVTASYTLYLRRPRDPEAMLLATSFLPLCFFSDTAFWLTALLHVPAAYLDNIAVFAWPLAFVAVALVPDGRFVTRWSHVAAAGAVTLPVLNTVFLQFPAFAHAGISTAINVVFDVTLLSAVASVLLRFVRLPAGDKRQQIKWTLVGATVTAITVLVSNILQTGYVTFAPPGFVLVNALLHIVLFTALPAALLVSVLGYRMYDAEAAITRSTSLAALSVTLLAIFAAAENVVSGIGSQYVSHSLGSFTGAIAAAFTAMTISPLHTRLKSWSERSFRADLFRMREKLPPLVGDLRETTDLENLVDIALDRIEAGVRASAAVVLVREEVVRLRGMTPEAFAGWRAGWRPRNDVSLDCAKTDPVLPLRIALDADGVGQVGWLLLGPRPDGSFYGKDERKALGEIADPLARAVAIALTRRDRSVAREELSRTLTARMGEIEATLARLAQHVTKGKTAAQEKKT